MGQTLDISSLIDELVCYGIRKGLIEDEDRIYCINRLLELFEEPGFTPAEVPSSERERR